MRDQLTGEMWVKELKASLRAVLKKTQRAFLEALSTEGGTIVGKGKLKFEGGLELSPIPYTVQRPKISGDK